MMRRYSRYFPYTKLWCLSMAYHFGRQGRLKEGVAMLDDARLAPKGNQGW